MKQDEIVFLGMTISRLIAIGVVALLAIGALAAARYVLPRIIMRILPRSRKNWGHILVERRVWRWLAGLAPAVVLAVTLPVVLGDDDRWLAFAQTLLAVYVVVLSALIVNAAVNAALDIYESYPLSKLVPLTSLAQATKVIVFMLAGLVFLSLSLGISPILVIGGFSALLATLSFVLRDPILGFVASIQLAANNMVAIGDRIEMPQHGADGDILEIGLTTVKVRNSDNTISTIPTYALVSGSVKNWHPMKESGGRRFKWPIYIDVSTVSFCTMAKLESYMKIDFVSEYIGDMKNELEAQPAGSADAATADLAALVDGRHVTNLELFRAFIAGYLRNHPKIHHEMSRLARVRTPTAHGIPVEIYAYSTETAFVGYEQIRSEIVEHVVAMAPEFDLQVFQHPAGADFKAFGDAANE